MSTRLHNEIEHGKRLLEGGAENIWNWASAAGQVRANRRADFFIKEAGIRSMDNVLEIGCGTGLFTRKVYEATKAQITAIDISEDLLNEARKLLPEATFKLDDAMHLSFANESFDVVFGSSVIHHLEMKKALEEMLRVLKKNGRIIFAEPNMINPQILIQKNIPFIKKRLGDSPDESAIVRWKFSAMMHDIGFRNIRIFPYDFLHPITPVPLIPLVNGIGKILEHVPLIKEIAGSVIIYGEK